MFSTHLISTSPHELSITDFCTTEHIISQTLPLNGKITFPSASESLERIKSSMLINNPLTVTQEELDTVDHSQNVKCVRSPNRVAKQPEPMREMVGHSNI